MTIGPKISSSAWLAAIVQSSEDAIISKDLTGIVRSWNPAAERLFGYAAAEIVGRPISIMAVPGREGEHVTILERIRRGERIEHYETVRRRKDGRLVDISLTVSPIVGPSGRIVGASKIARDISERKESEARLRMVMGELDHRAKNLLAVTSAMIRLTRAESIESFIKAVEGRIDALARVHSRVAHNRWDGAELHDIVRDGLRPFQPERVRIGAGAPHAFLTPVAAQATALLLHELATNAAKHGAWSVPDGTVEVCWRLLGGENPGLSLAWTERGGPPGSAPARRSFGLAMIERQIPDQLGGTASIEWRPEGLRCVFVIPAAYLASEPPVRRAGAAAGGVAD